jgi:hypothetical protein
MCMWFDHNFNEIAVVLKDRLQEVKKTLLPRKCLSAFERYPCPQATHKKKAIKPNPHLDPWDHRFPVPLHSLPCSPSLLFSTNHIIPTFISGVCRCFHSQSGLKNPEHLTFLYVSSVHHIW